jgi:uncharacterized protein (DUF111 family)
MVGRAGPADVAGLATRAVRALAVVEGGLHGVPADAVHLHEIGGVDTVVDTVGVAAALRLLDVDDVRCGPLALGSGTVTTRHGLLPLPAPATAALLAVCGAPVTSTGLPGETVTPTGIALLHAAAARFGPVPPMTVASSATAPAPATCRSGRTSCRPCWAPVPEPCPRCSCSRRMWTTSPARSSGT